MGFAIHQLVITILEVGKLAAKISQLAIIFIEALVGQHRTASLVDPSLEESGIEVDED